MSPAKKIIYYFIHFILYINLFNTIKTKGPSKTILLKSAFIPKPLKNPLASCSLINFDFLLSHYIFW